MTSPTEENEVVMERIHVEVKRTGGFGGLVTSRSFDSDSLPTDDARRLTDLVSGLDFEALRHQPESTRSVPDAFQYDIAISRGAENLRLRVRDPDVPAELRPLISFVMQRT
jgi:emfourin